MKECVYDALVIVVSGTLRGVAYIICIFGDTQGQLAAAEAL